MKKNRKLLILTAIMAMLIVLTYKVTENPSSVLSKESLSDFSIDDTASIDKLIISNTDGFQVDLVKKGNVWVMADGSPVQQDPVRTILKTIKRIQVKSTIPKTSHETVINQIIGTHEKVQIFVKGKLEKTYYVGHPTADHYGTYMLLEDPEKGRSPEPFIMYLPGHNGHLSSRFFANPEEWRFSGIFNYDPLAIKEIHVKNHENITAGFTIRALNEKDFELLDYKNNRAIIFDTVSVREYVTHYRKIHYDFVEQNLTKEMKDSILQTSPFRSIEVKTKTGENKKIACYHRKARVEETDLEGNLIMFDRDRFIGLIDGEKWVVCQFFVFDKLFQDYSFFVSDEKLVGL